MDIYVQKDGQQRGPFPETKIREGIDAGEFAPADLAWTTGKASWQPLSALISLDVNQAPPVHERASATIADASIETPSIPPSLVNQAVNGEFIYPPGSLAPTADKTMFYGKRMIHIVVGLVGMLIFSLISSFPLAVALFDRTSTGWYTLGMTAMALGFMAIGVSGAISNIEVGFLPSVELAKKSLFGMNKSTQLSPAQTPHHIRNWYYVYIPGVAAAFLICILLAFHWKDHFPEHVDPKAWDRLNKRQGFEKDQPDPRSRVATMRGNEEAFIALYGKPLKVSHGAQPPATDDLVFRNGDLVYQVSFWYGSAHNVLVWRWDDNPLTEQDIEKGLAAFSEGEEWALQSHAGPYGIDIWRRIGVVAFVEDVRSKVPNAPETIPVNDLRIVTDELLTKKGSDQ